jgi:hypothetical protein
MVYEWFATQPLAAAHRSQAIMILSSSYFVLQTQYNLSSIPSSASSSSASPGAEDRAPGAGVVLTGMTDVDLDRAVMVDLFVTVDDNFLFFKGAVGGPSEDTLSFVFAEPLGLARLLGCACCFVLWGSVGRAEGQTPMESPSFSELDAPLVSECSFQNHELTRLCPERRLTLFPD